MEFEADNRGIKSIIDATPEHGGNNKGPGPKELVLNGMLGCTAMDVLSILNKMRQPPNNFFVEIEVEKTTEHPIYFKSGLIKFYIEGEVEIAKIKKSIDASLTKYCGVNFMISQVCDLDFIAFLNGREVHQGKVDFSKN